MNRTVLKREAEKWKVEGIISDEQFQRILARYRVKKSNPYLLLTFAGLFVGLGFLTFIASNWEGIADIGKMAIILIALLAFYSAGNHLYHHRSVRLGLSFILIGLLTFGAGIFLTGQMYHYTFLTAIPFVAWSLAGLALFMVYPHASLFFTAILITTVGQLYSGMTYQSVSYVLLLVLLFGFGHFTYHQGKHLYGYLFAGSFILQALVLCLAEQQPYYWLLIYFLLLYLFGLLVQKKAISQAFRHIGLLAAFLLNVFQVFFLSETFWREQLETEIWFWIGWALLFLVIVGLKVMKQTEVRAIDLILFLPIFILPLADMAAMLLLFIFSLGYLLAGYAEQAQEKIVAGTIAFLFSTLIAYVHLAWDFLDKSLFFFIGGISLFLLSLFLERKRRRVADRTGEAQ